MKKFLYIFLFLVVILAGLGLYHFLNIKNKPARTQKTLLEWKIAGYDMRLLRYYLTVKKLKRDEVVNLAKKDCFENKVTPAIPGTLQFVDPYLSNLKDKFLSSLGLNEKKARGLIYLYEKVPDTDQCWLIWAVDTNGRGVIGYENKNGNIQLNSSSLSEDQINYILNRINK